MQGWTLTGFFFFFFFFSPEEDSFLFKLLLVVYYNSFNVWRQYSTCRSWQSTSLSLGYFCNPRPWGLTKWQPKILLKRQSIARKMKQNQSKLTEHITPPGRRATCILKSLACSKVTATCSRSLVEQTKCISYIHSKRNTEYTYIYWIVVQKLQNVYLCLHTHQKTFKQYFYFLNSGLES